CCPAPEVLETPVRLSGDTTVYENFLCRNIPGGEGAWSEDVVVGAGADGSEGVCPEGVAVVEEAWPVAQDGLDSAERLPAAHANAALAQEKTQLSELQEEQRGSSAKYVTAPPQSITGM
ncbi:hypothetical protein M9458_027723, partial [Cirrhinus mrigala]